MSKDTSPIILAFSGGLDTSFCVPWLEETYQRPVITATVDTGGIDSAAANALEERALLAARVESRRAVIGALPNGAVNLLFAKKAMEEHDAPDALVALPPGGGPDPKDVAALGGTGEARPTTKVAAAMRAPNAPSLWIDCMRVPW